MSRSMGARCLTMWERDIQAYGGGVPKKRYDAVSQQHGGIMPKVIAGDRSLPEKINGDRRRSFQGEMGLIDVKRLIFITGFLLSGEVKRKTVEMNVIQKIGGKNGKLRLYLFGRFGAPFWANAAGRRSYSHWDCLLHQSPKESYSAKMAGSMSKEQDSSNGAATSATALIPLTNTTASLIKVEKPRRRLDVITPTGGVPVFNPSNPAGPTMPIYNPVPTPYPTLTPPIPTMTPENPDTAPGMGTPLSSGQSWCIASQTASQTTLQVALDYACGYGGADCAEIQPGSSCYNPNTIRDHASYAFNSYYQKNPVPTSCDFGGTAVITNVDPRIQLSQTARITIAKDKAIRQAYPRNPRGLGGLCGLHHPDRPLPTSTISIYCSLTRKSQ
ncbi:Glucan endo-1,3-beta-glucosidase 1 [Platanthera guangdongensis]|uniref:Glucan endo-1,3-beta-glucosidase 1 n=1 Tax=Platanthera guangdongensis TaxID=2320717 RepID=A0ABR2MFI0_9ASPA